MQQHTRLPYIIGREHQRALSDMAARKGTGCSGTHEQQATALMASSTLPAALMASSTLLSAAVRSIAEEHIC
eukprot:881691-Pelagomonas_calceolata.AAC.2